MSSPLSDVLDVARYHLLVTQTLFGSGYSLLIWDWLVCIKREYKYIWHMKFSFIQCIYLFCRFWPILTVPYVLYAYTINHTGEHCRAIFRIPVALATWNQLSAEAILAARTSAFLGSPRWARILLPLCLAGLAMYQMWVVFVPMQLLPFIPPAVTGPCLPTTANDQIFGFFISSFFFDCLVSGLMLWRLFLLLRETRDLGRNPLIHLFISEGLWYFVLVSAANLANGIMYVQPTKTLSAIMVPFSNMVPNILSCRLILDLRQHGNEMDNDWLISESTSQNPNRPKSATSAHRRLRIWDYIFPKFPTVAASSPGDGTVSTIKFTRPATRRPVNTSAIGSDGSTTTTGSYAMEAIVETVEVVKEKDIELGVVIESENEKAALGEEISQLDSTIG